METWISEWISPELIDSITHTIIQSIWQGGLIGIITWLWFRKSSNNPVVRYRIALLGLTTLFVCCLITFAMSYSSGVTLDTTEVVKTITNWTTDIVVLDDEYLTITNTWIGYLWIIGVIGFTAKFVIDLAIVEYIKKNSFSNEETALYEGLLSEISLANQVKLRVSNVVNAPVTVGFLKPLILFPVGMMTQLTTAEVESILRHEMAHIVRKDYLVNIIQTTMEIVLFYHPLVWWLSRVSREQREYCCDDVALAQNSAMDYAKTLVRIQELALDRRQSLAMSFADQSLMNRIKRIMNLPKSNRNMREKLIASVAILTLVIFFSKDMIANVTDKIWNKIEIENEEVPRDEVALNLDIMPIDTLPKISKHSYTMTKSDDDGSITIQKENGKITKLEIDGKQIPESDYDQYEDQIDQMEGRSSRGNTWIFRNGEDLTPEEEAELEERLEEFGESMEEWGENFGETFGENFGKSMEEWGENFGETFGKDMEEWGEEFGRSMEIWGQQFEDDFEWNIEDGDSSRSFSFVMPDIDENMLLNLEDIMKDFDLKGMDIENFRIPELNQSMDELSEMLENLELEGLDLRGLDRDRDMLGSDFGKSRTVEDKIGYELRKDRLISTGEVSEVELSGKHMKINGEKQPTNIWNKYKEIFEEESGFVLSSDSKLKFKVEGKKTMKKSSAF